MTSENIMALVRYRLEQADESLKPQAEFYSIRDFLDRR